MTKNCIKYLLYVGRLWFHIAIHTTEDVEASTKSREIWIRYWITKSHVGPHLLGMNMPEHEYNRK